MGQVYNRLPSFDPRWPDADVDTPWEKREGTNVFEGVLGMVTARGQWNEIRSRGEVLFKRSQLPNHQPTAAPPRHKKPKP